MSGLISGEQIRAATADDLEAIRDVHLSAFGGRAAEANLVILLHSAKNAQPSLLATVDDGIVVGHIVFSPVRLDGSSHSSRILGLGPLAVRPKFQRLGIGTRLVRAGIDACVAEGFDAIVVLGYPTYYGRFGFRPAKALGFSNEYGAGDHFMILETKSNSMKGLSGLLKYGPEFAAAGC